MRLFLLSLIGLFLWINCCNAVGEGKWALTGIFDPGRGSEQQTLVAMSRWSQKAPAIQVLFTTFDKSDSYWLFYGNELENIWKTGFTPMITWEPWFMQDWTPSDIERRIWQGEYDDYLRYWASLLRVFIAGPDKLLNTVDDRRVYMRFAHEFNGNWYPWSAKKGETTPQDWIKMWNYVRQVVASTGLTKNHVQWVWSAICFDLGDWTLEQYYPGHGAVDWVAVSGMNWGTSETWFYWIDVVDLFDSVSKRIKTVSAGLKPFGISEVSTVSIGKGVVGKDRWLRSLYTWVETNKVRMVNYFNMDKVEGPPNNNGVKDWAIFGGSRGDTTYTFGGKTYKAYNAYKQYVSQPYYIGHDTAIPKYIANKYFFGTGTCNMNADCLKGWKCNNGTKECVRSGAVRASTSKGVKPSLTIRPSTGKVILNDTITPKYLKWGSDGVQLKFNTLDTLAPEGRKDVQLWSTSMGGFGITYVKPISLSKYSNLQFYLKSLDDIKIEVQDANGNKVAYTTPSTNGLWKLVKIPLWNFNGIDWTKINGPFFATLQNFGYFAVDWIQYVH